jgi:hypothetical protein
MLLVGEITRAVRVREENGDVIARKTFRSSSLDDVDRLPFGLSDTENCFVRHENLLL